MSPALRRGVKYTAAAFMLAAAVDNLMTGMKMLLELKHDDELDRQQRDADRHKPPRLVVDFDKVAASSGDVPPDPAPASE